MSSSSEEKYLAALRAERERLTNLFLCESLPISMKLLEDEILRVQAQLGIEAKPQSQPYSSLYFLNPPKPDNAIKLTEKVYIPVQEYPDFNFVGRIIGPRGRSLQRIESETGCKIMIRGQGSMKEKEKEEEKRGKPGWEHLNEPLHVLIECEMEESKAREAIQKAREIVDKLLVPMGEDVDYIKKYQLQELARIKAAQMEPAFKLAPGAAALGYFPYIAPSIDTLRSNKRARGLENY